MTDTVNRFNHIDETVGLPWGTVRVRCDIPKGDPSLEANLRASIRANASVSKGPQDRSVIETIIVQNYEDVRHLHVDIKTLANSLEITNQPLANPAS